jgi:hypothetical protein
MSQPTDSGSTNMIQLTDQEWSLIRPVVSGRQFRGLTDFERSRIGTNLSTVDIPKERRDQVIAFVDQSFVGLRDRLRNFTKN